MAMETLATTMETKMVTTMLAAKMELTMVTTTRETTMVLVSVRQSGRDVDDFRSD